MYNEVLNALYRGENEEVLDKTHAQRLALRILSFDPYNMEVASRLDKYFMKIDRVLFSSMLKRIPFKHTEEITYISKGTEKADVYTEFFKRIAKLYRWSMRELDANMPVLQLFLEDREWVKEMGLKVGLSREQLRKLGISVDKPKKRIRKNMSLTDFVGR